jgi:hypothetical protein
MSRGSTRQALGVVPELTPSAPSPTSFCQSAAASASDTSGTRTTIRTAKRICAPSKSMACASGPSSIATTSMTRTSGAKTRLIQRRHCASGRYSPPGILSLRPFRASSFLRGTHWRRRGFRGRQWSPSHGPQTGTTEKHRSSTLRYMRCCRYVIAHRGLVRRLFRPGTRCCCSVSEAAGWSADEALLDCMVICRRRFRRPFESCRRA